MSEEARKQIGRMLRENIEAMTPRNHREATESHGVFSDDRQTEGHQDQYETSQTNLY